MRNTKKGFTLVELIVVITILAILGTIAFISLGSYTADARNAKRLDGISKLATAIDNDQLSGKSLLAYVTADTANNATTVSIAGTGTILGTDYQAGDINATALNVKAEQFQDPSSSDLYKIGVATGAGGVYELAAKLEEGAGSISAVKGNYNPRAADTKTVALTATGDTTVSLSTVTDINFFKVGDTITVGAGAGFVITNISSDGTTVTVDSAITGASASGTTVQLGAAEGSALITSTGVTDSADGSVTNNSTTVFPY